MPSSTLFCCSLDCHKTFPARSASSANITPDFCPARSIDLSFENLRRIGGFAKSTSAPGAAGQLEDLAQHAVVQLSFAVVWLAQRCAPVSRSIARMASVLALDMSVYELPVPTY